MGRKATENGRSSQGHKDAGERYFGGGVLPRYGGD